MALLIAVPVMAQDISGSMSGTVKDPDGSPLPGVAVMLGSSLVPSSTIYTQANGVYRFPTLPPGNDYSLTFRLEGFTTVIHTEVLIRVSGDTQINVDMGLASLEETVTVVGGTPIVDVKDTGIGNNVTEEYMQSIPSARDPWVMLEHTAGMQMSQQNIGGSASGQQQGFRAYGSKGSDTVWSYDGAVATDMTAVGGSAMYYDFDAFEEISITTAGNDPSVQTGGIHINFVTRRGGNVWRGSGRFYITDGSLQSENNNYSAEELFPGYTGNSIDNIKDYGAEIGGPLVRDRFYIWGAYGRQDIKQLVGETPDNTQLTNWHAKANWHIGNSAVLNYTFIHANKTKQGRGASPLRPPATTFDQGDPSPIHTGKLQYTLNDNNYLEATYRHQAAGFFVRPQGGLESQVTWDLGTGVWGRSFYFYELDSPFRSAKLDGNSYLAGASIDHELKYGYSFRDGTALSEWGPGGGAVAIFINGRPAEAWLVQDDQDHYTGAQHGLYLGDTISAGRATFNVGLRYDHQTSKALPSAVPAHVLAPDLFPAVTFDGYDSGFAWDSVSPRFGLTYDLSGDARTILRLNAARYYSQMSIGELAWPKITTQGREMDFEWSDLDGDGSIDVGETGDLLWVSGGWDPSDPNAGSPNIVTETTAPYTDELLLGIERELSRTFGIGANFIYRRNSNATWDIRAGEEDDAFWTPVTQQIPGYGPLDVYQPVGPRALHNVYQQRDDYNTRYVGLELFLNKRFSNRWMANASLVFGNNTQNFTGTRGYTDPTNVAAVDGQTFTPLASSRNRQRVPFGALWHLKTSGMYQFGGSGLSLAGFLQVRQGNLNPDTVRSSNRAFGSGRVYAYPNAVGDDRLRTYWNLDLRAEKTFDFASRGRLHLIVDAFNLTNNDIALGAFNQVNSSNYARLTEVMQGRTIRFGVRLVLR